MQTEGIKHYSEGAVIKISGPEGYGQQMIALRTLGNVQTILETKVKKCQLQNGDRILVGSDLSKKELNMWYGKDISGHLKCIGVACLACSDQPKCDVVLPESVETQTFLERAKEIELAGTLKINQLV